MTYTRAIRLTAMVLLAGFSTATAQVELPAALRDDKAIVTLSVAATLEETNEVKGVATARIEPGWHINSWKPLDEFSIPTVLSLEAPGVANPTIDYPAHKEESFSFAGGTKLAVYDGTLQIPFHAKSLGDGGTLRAALRYQACNDKVCLPPKSVEATVLLVAHAAPRAAGAAGGSAAGTPGSTTTAGDPAAATTETAGGETSADGESQGSASQAPAAAAPDPASFTPLSNAPAGGGSLWSGDLASTFSSRGLGLTLLIVFVAGLALNLTPCVYPLIPITLAFFTSQSSGSRSRRAGFALLYVLGIAITYSVLGVFAALSGKLFGALLQSTAVLVFFASLMLVLSLSMFGLYEIQIPAALTNRASARAGYAGALTMGLLVGIVAAPCVGPFVISLIALVGQLGDPVMGFVLFFALALGLGVPYLVLGVFSSSLSALPRSGVWMEHVKKAMGFVLVAMAFYFLRPVLGDVVYVRGVAASLLLGGAYLIFTGWGAGKQGRGVRIACAIILLAGGVVFALPSKKASAGELEWSKFSDSLLDEARREGRPVLIDFYADWCLPCKELDEKTFTDERVMAEAERFTRLKADLTNVENRDVAQLGQRFGVVGVPTIVFIGRDGQEIRNLRLTGFERPNAFLERLKQVK